MPYGHVPAIALDKTEQFGCIDCRIEIPVEAVVQLRRFLEEETGKSREKCFRWYTDDFAVAAQLAWKELKEPKITLDIAWDVFSQMAPVVVTFLDV